MLRQLRRRRIVQLAALSPAALLAAACAGGGGGQTSVPRQPGGMGAAGSRMEPKGELKTSFGIHMPANLDATQSGFELIFVGVGETLTRLTRDQKPEPWLAERVTNVDPTTWRVTLRPNAKFHDGSPVTAQDVVGSFQRSWETQPAANLFISKDTRVTAVDTTTVDFKLPAPAGAFVNNLATFQFVIAKPGANGSVMTGPYKPVRLDTDAFLQLESFRDHWGGPPPIARVSIRNAPDANARALALQSGDVDMVFGMPPDLIKGLPNDIERAVIPSTRIHYVTLNHARPFFDDRNVRMAFGMGIDRAKVNEVALDGKGAVATNLFPPGAGAEVVPAQATDIGRARQLLDDAGWRVGGDGVRVKDGRRLAFTLYSYPGRAELTPMAVVIQSQLKPLGFDLNIQSVQNITSQLRGGDWDASMISINAAPTGDPLYMFVATLIKGGASAWTGFDNAQLNALVEQMRAELDPARRQALARQGQEIVRAEWPNAYLVGAPLAYLYKKGKVEGFQPHPNDLYYLDSSFWVT
jgi:peptide/nickel transport system substrate-binding protein